MVNTFIVNESFEVSADNLDNKRLGKQRVEAKQIIDILIYYDEYKEIPKKGFSNHPAVKMWKGYTNALKLYCNVMINKWISRGFKNTMTIYELPENIELPWWVNFEPLHLSHKASLNRKDPNFYKFKNLGDYINKGYLWVRSDEKIDKFSMDMLSPIGSGSPANYQITEQEVIEWLKNKLINPKTGRKIKKDAATYKLYVKAQKIYKIA